MKHTEKIIQALVEANILDENDLPKQLAAAAESTHADIEEFIGQRKKIDPKKIFEVTAKAFGVPYIDLRSKPIDEQMIQLLPESIVQSSHVIVFAKDDAKRTISLAMRDPDDIQTIDFIQKKTGLDAIVYYTDTASIEEMSQQYHRSLQEEIQTLTSQKTDTPNHNSRRIAELNTLAQDLPIVKVVDAILDYAVYENASDIHIEPTEKSVIIRYRVDGILMDVMTLPKSVQNGIIARVKILSNLKIDEHRLPQDGRFKSTLNDKQVAFRVSIFPIYDGEKVVLRILDESAKILTFEQLGMQKNRADIIRSNIQKPHGTILITGPTGSGKTTTLYSIINILNTPRVNISTIEDPIEYRMPRVNQSQIAPKIGFSFAMGLRALLRQDPNIIMVGEIRDGETAEIASHAAMTGHLVLSTLHTNDAVGAIPRLTEMGVPHYLIASTVNVIIAQRLVRKICQHCVINVDVTQELISEIEQQFNFENIVSVLKEAGEIEPKSAPTDMHFYKGKGCEQCGDRGYKGRIGIYEILENSPEITDQILAQAPSETLFEIARKEGMMTMVEDGFIKAKQGLTSIEEVLRVTKE